MRLIDVDKIEINEECTFSGKGIKDFLNAIPTAYDADKVVEQLEEKTEAARKYWNEFDDEGVFGEMHAYQKAAGIVKSCGIE